MNGWSQKCCGLWECCSFMLYHKLAVLWIWKHCIKCWSPNFCRTWLHLGISVKLKIWQVLACKMESLSGIMNHQPDKPPTHSKDISSSFLNNFIIYHKIKKYITYKIFIIYLFIFGGLFQVVINLSQHNASKKMQTICRGRAPFPSSPGNNWYTVSWLLKYPIVTTSTQPQIT